MNTYPMLPIFEDFSGDLIDVNLWTTKTIFYSNVSQSSQVLNLQGGGQLITG